MPFITNNSSINHHHSSSASAILEKADQKSRSYQNFSNHNKKNNNNRFSDRRKRSRSRSNSRSHVRRKSRSRPRSKSRYCKSRSREEKSRKYDSREESRSRYHEDSRSYRGDANNGFSSCSLSSYKREQSYKSTSVRLTTNESDLAKRRMSNGGLTEKNGCDTRSNDYYQQKASYIQTTSIPVYYVKDEKVDFCYLAIKFK